MDELRGRLEQALAASTRSSRAEADPELQPQVSEIRARLERLRARAGCRVIGW